MFRGRDAALGLAPLAVAAAAVLLLANLLRLGDDFAGPMPQPAAERAAGQSWVMPVPLARLPEAPARPGGGRTRASDGKAARDRAASRGRSAGQGTAAQGLDALAGVRGPGAAGLAAGSDAPPRRVVIRPVRRPARPQAPRPRVRRPAPQRRRVPAPVATPAPAAAFVPPPAVTSSPAPPPVPPAAAPEGDDEHDDDDPRKEKKEKKPKKPKKDKEPEDD